MFVGCAAPDEPQSDKTYFHSVRVVGEISHFVIKPSGSIDVPIAVYDAEAFSLSSYQPLLRLAGTTRSPEEVVLQQIKRGDIEGRYTAQIEDAGLSDSYTIEVTLDFKDASGTVVRSNPFIISTNEPSAMMTSFKFERTLNPQLSKDVHMTYNAAERAFSGATDNFVEDLNLIATFDCNGKVTIDGVEQVSGRSKADFSKSVTYTIEYEGVKSECVVSLRNFTGLPVMIINTADGAPITSKEDWKDASIELRGGLEFDDLEECDVEIRGRGNSTWGYDKKPYALKFPSKTSLLGMPKHKRWVLLANTMDRTMMRNRVAYHIAELTSLAWTPRTEFVEIILNGKHIGNYLLTEQIRIDKHRINIAELEPSDNDGEAITGGYVYEMDFHFDNVNQWWTSQGFPSSVKFPDEDDISPEQLEWAIEYFNRVEATLYGPDFKDPDRGYASLIDVQSFVDYWLVYEVCINHELANPGSVYLHKDRGGKLTAGPIWDFDWGTFSYSASPQAQGKLFMMGAIWYERLFEDPAFKAVAKERWQVLAPKFRQVESFILEEYDYLQVSAQRNFSIWNPATTGNVNGDTNISFDEAVERMYDLYVERIETLDRIFSSW